MAHHTFKSFNDFLLENNLDRSIFRSYIDFLKQKKWGKDHRRCELTLKDASEMGMQVHHVLPRCFGGTRIGNNKVILTKEEHIKAHVKLQGCLEKLVDKKYALKHNWKSEMKGNRKNLTEEEKARRMKLAFERKGLDYEGYMRSLEERKHPILKGNYVPNHEDNVQFGCCCPDTLDNWASF